MSARKKVDKKNRRAATSSNRSRPTRAGAARRSVRQSERKVFGQAEGEGGPRKGVPEGPAAKAAAAKKAKSSTKSRTKAGKHHRPVQRRFAQEERSRRRQGPERETNGSEIGNQERAAKQDEFGGARPLTAAATPSRTSGVIPFRFRGARRKSGAAVKEQNPAPREAPARRGERRRSRAPNRHGFKLSEFVVYPAHGVGQIVAIEEQEVAGFKLELFVISFSKDKMTLRVPTSKGVGVGMRKISDPDTAKRSLDILTGRARVKRTMWSRRAQEYEAKINSGDINAIAEVVRDLFRSDAQPEQSYSERQLYEAALDRMVREIAAVQRTSELDALRVVEAQLQRSHGRSSKASGGPADGVVDPEIEEAA